LFDTKKILGGLKMIGFNMREDEDVENGVGSFAEFSVEVSIKFGMKCLVGGC